MRESMFTSSHGDRPNNRNVGIVLTDGESNDRAKTFREAVANRNKNIEMIAIGVGLKVCIKRQHLSCGYCYSNSGVVTNTPAEQSINPFAATPLFM